MGFAGVYRALYDYTPQAEGELTIGENDLLFVLDKNGDDGWWKAKKKARAEDEDEPIGLVPNNYVEQAQAVGHARALYEYTRQTDEELSFLEDSILDIFDTSDPDWILVGLDGDYGFVPANYIDMESVGGREAAETEPPAPALPVRPTSVAEEPTSPVKSAPPAVPVPAGPAAALAGVMQSRSSMPPASPSPPQPPREQATREHSQFEDYHHASDEEAPSPALPSRPRPSVESAYAEPPRPQRPQRPIQPVEEAHADRGAPGDFHMYNVNEMVSVLGKRKKMPTTLGINLRTGVIMIAPERSEDGPTQEWTAEKMTHYSREGKHVFMELVRPSKSIDFHAGAKDTADEITRALGEMAGAVRAEGLKEVIMAGTKKSKKKGVIQYDFKAQGEDEVTVAVGDDVIIMDDSKSDEWWQVRRLKNGKEGVVPSSYVEITGTVTPPPVDPILSAVEQNRLEELRLTKEALKASKDPQQVGPGMALPERGSSLNNSDLQQSRRQNGRNEGSSSKGKTKPDLSKVRTWTDRSKSFSVEAQFLGLKDGKIHIHKLNGVKIAVPISKMSSDDIEYVENLTGVTLHEAKPRSSSKKAPVETVKKDTKPEYDWFDFFLSCEVAVGLCERYAQAFHRDSMDESVLPDIDATVLRTLGLREGDIIKVMRTLDAKYGRQKPKDGDGGLFSGPGGTLRNNTRKGRPAPAVQTSDIVDASAFGKKDGQSPTQNEAAKSTSSTSPPPNVQDTKQPPAGSFDDDAWDVKPSQQPQQPTPAKTQSPPPAASAAAPPPANLMGSMKDLSLLSEPLEPTKTGPQPSPPAQPLTQPLSLVGATPPQTAAPAQQGATPGFFQTLQSQPTGLPRQRPAPPSSVSPPQGSLVPPPPQRPLSTPAQPTAFQAPALAPQMTGAQVALPGQSLSEIAQARLQQQQQQQQQQQYMAQMQQPSYTGFLGAQPQGIMSMPVGPQGHFMQPMMTGAPGQSPFADPGAQQQTMFSTMQAQPTGFQQSFNQQQQPSFGQQPPPGGINNYLPPALEPQKTGMSMQPMQTQPTGISGFHQPATQPLQPQQTGPAPPIRFGVSPEPKKLAPQPTGRKANLSHATPQNPFGF